MVLVWGSQFHDEAFRVPMMFLAVAYLFHTTGELCLSPVGLSEMTKLAPPALISTLMAVWFMATSGGQYVAGIIARLTASETVAGQVLDPAAALHTYVTTFRNIGLAGIALGVLLLALSPWLKRLAHGVNDPGNHPAPEPIAPVFDGDRQALNPGMVRGGQAPGGEA
jgi:POT family proton-dependent oligopeptide transporter